MKLIIQVPCLNEGETLRVALAELPRTVEGFDSVEWLVIDDGSSDDTAQVAHLCGVDHVVRHSVNRGLAEAFKTGIETCLTLGADVIVNTDADNQYNGADIPKLTSAIIAGRADIVIGARPIAQTEHFSWIKKKLQHLGSWVVRVASHTEVADAPSGFRAISRDAAMRLNVFNGYTYTLETIIQAGQSNMRVISVPIRTNADIRPSRLVSSLPNYVRRSLLTIFRMFVIYRPLAFFSSIGGIFACLGIGAGVRFMYFFLHGDGAGHIQSVIFSALCIIVGLLLCITGLIGDLIATNRKLLERIDLRLQRIERYRD